MLLYKDDFGIKLPTKIMSLNKNFNQSICQHG